MLCCSLSAFSALQIPLLQWRTATTCIVFGADLTDEQRSQVIGMFGIQGEVDENRILTVTNAEERLYFEGKIPSGQIGQRSISSIYICAMPAGQRS